MRIASFNVENLFSRPAVLDIKDHARVDMLLRDIAEYRNLLEAADYAPHRARIRELHLMLRDYVFLNIRASQVGRYVISADGTVIAAGKGDWEGFVDFKRARFPQEQIGFTAKVIRTVGADVQALVEVESRDTLGRFNTDLLNSVLRDKVVIDGNDPRGINVALGTRKTAPITAARTNVFARAGQRTVYSRDCLEVEVATGADRPLHILVNHFKAKDSSPASSDAKREMQARHVAQILTTRYDLDRDWVVVVGDLNDEPASAPLQPLLSVNGLHNAFDLAGRPADDRWTYYYGLKKQRNAIDYLLVSEGLRSRFQAAGIERRGIAGQSRITGGAEREFDGITSWRNAASDHAAVWADFDIPLAG